MTTNLLSTNYCLLTTSKRHGTTLTEVLVAIFIMAIGMMSLLTLFPVGALTMSQAIKDDRVSQAAANAAAIAEARGLRHDSRVRQQFDAMATYASPADPPPLTGQYADGPSYPVFVDPMGLASGAPPTVGWTGRSPGIRRERPSFIPAGPPSAPHYRWFSLLDDLTYLDPATNSAYGVPTDPLIPSPQTVQREGRYTWAYMLRRPRYNDSGVVDLTVLTYNARSQVTPFGENVYWSPAAGGQVVFDPATTIVNVPYQAMGKPVPDIRKGSWIMDATVQRRTGSTVTPDPHCYFYRVVNVTDAGGILSLELQSPPKADTINNSDSVMVFLDGVAEVFHKGAGWQP